MGSLFKLLVLYLVCLLKVCTSNDEDSAQNEATNGIPAIDSDFLFLRIDESTLPLPSGKAGLGVFAKVNIPAREIICEYRGAVIPASIPFKSNYIFNTKTYDGIDISIVPDMNKPICAYINDCVHIYGGNYSTEDLNDIESKIASEEVNTNNAFPNHIGFSHNAHVIFTKMGKIFIGATHDIKAGEEIFYPYGAVYWLTRLRHPEAFDTN